MATGGSGKIITGARLVSVQVVALTLDRFAGITINTNAYIPTATKNTWKEYERG